MLYEPDPGLTSFGPNKLETLMRMEIGFFLMRFWRAHDPTRPAGWF